MGKKGKTEVGTEGGVVVKKNPTQIWPYLCDVLFQVLSQLAPNTRTSRLLKMIYNTKISLDKQNASGNVRP